MEEEISEGLNELRCIQITESDAAEKICSFREIIYFGDLSFLYSVCFLQYCQSRDPLPIFSDIGAVFMTHWEP